MDRYSSMRGASDRDDGCCAHRGALAALFARYRSAEVDASYAAYDEHPLDEPRPR